MSYLVYVKRKTILDVLITSYKVENHFAVSRNTKGEINIREVTFRFYANIKDAKQLKESIRNSFT